MKIQRNENSEAPSTRSPRVNQEKDASVNSTNTINTVSPTVNTIGNKDNVIDENIVYGCANDLNMPESEDIVYSNNDKDVGGEADINNLDAFMSVSPIPTTRIHKDHPQIGCTQDTQQEEGTDYDEVRLKRKSMFDNHKIENPDFPDRVYKVEKALYGLHQAPKAL
ncbi:hypothetical protein Tco_0650322 [Tanacetum coccineum]